MAEPLSHYNKVEGSSPATTTGMERERKNGKKKVPLVQPLRPFYAPSGAYYKHRENQRGKDHCTIDLLFDWFGISCMTTGNFFCKPD